MLHWGGVDVFSLEKNVDFFSQAYVIAIGKFFCNINTTARAIIRDSILSIFLCLELHGHCGKKILRVPRQIDLIAIK